MTLRTHARTGNPLSCTSAIRFPCLPRAHPQVIACLTSNCRFVCGVYCVFFLRNLFTAAPSPNIAALEGSDDVVNGPCLPGAINKCDWHESPHEAELGVRLSNCICERLIHR